MISATDSKANADPRSGNRDFRVGRLSTDTAGFSKGLSDTEYRPRVHL